MEVLVLYCVVESGVYYDLDSFVLVCEWLEFSLCGMHLLWSVIF